MALPGFIYGGNTGIKNPEELARARAYAEALLGPQRPAQNVGEGLAVLGQAIRGRREMNAANRASSAGQESAQSAIAKALGGMGAFPAAPAGGGAGGSPVSAQAPNTPYAGDIKSGIQSTAQALGIDPVDLGTAISYETAGTFDPAKKGPTTQWGQHKGLIQFGEPQAKQYGVDWQNPIGSQLGPDGAVAKYLTGHGVKPGMGLLDIYSAINAGGVGKYGASDANNGGAPGTVRDKVEHQMAAHRAKAMALLGGSQVASNDPGAGIAQAMAGPQQQAPAQQAIAAALNGPPQPGVDVGAPGAVTPAGQRVMGQMMNPQPMAQQPPQQAQVAPDQSGKPQGPGAPGEIRKGADGKNYQYAQTTGMAGATGDSGWIETSMAPQGQQTAQAQPGLDQIPVEAGGNGGAIPKGQLPSMQQLMEASQNPWLNDQQRGIVNMLMKQQMDQADPNNQLDAEYKRAQIGALNAKQDALPDSVKALKERASAAGLVEGSPEFKQFMVTGGRGPQTVINTGDNTSTFVKKSDEAAAKRIDDLVAAGQSAPQTMADMQQLIDLGSQIGTGKLADWKSTLGPYAEAAGIEIGGLDEIQAYKAITSRLAPQMRPAGSGSSSNTDVQMFMDSLPNLRNRPGANEMVANTMKAVTQNKMNAAEIARKAQRGDISWQDADEQISKLPNPYDLFKEFQKQTQKKTVIDGFTIEEVP